MQFKHTIVFAFVAIFMAVSCITVDKTLGEGMVPENQDLPIHSAEIDLPVQVKSSSPVQTISAGESIFGAIRTKEFGLVQFSTMADISPNMSRWDFGKDPVLKEIYFMAPITSTYTIEDDQKGIPQIITLHRTKKRIDTTTVFNNSITAADYDPEPLNESEYLYFGGDSLRIYLRKSLGEEILASSQAERDSLNLFVEKFKGMILKCSAPEEGIYGGRENFLSYGSGAIYMRVDYQPTWAEGLARKDTIFTLSWGYNYCVNISEYESASLETTEPGETIPYEGIAGVKPFISHTDMKNAIDNWKSEMGLADKTVIVAKGELIFPFEIPEDMDMTKYPSSIYPCNRELDTAYNALFYYPLEDVNVTGYSVGAIDRSLCRYAMDVPSYVQDMVSKEKSEIDETYDLWLMPTASQTDSYYNTTTYSLDCSTYFNGKINGPAAERRPKLRLVYSVLDE